MCLPNFTDIAEFGRKAAILFIQIRGLKTQNFAWEMSLSDLAHPNYDIKSGSQLLQKKMPFDPFMQGFFFWNVNRLYQKPSFLHDFEVYLKEIMFRVTGLDTIENIFILWIILKKFLQ